MEIQIKSSWKQFFLTILLLLSVANLFAQWQPDVRLTYDDSISFTSFNNAWCIASDINIVHVVWFDDRDGNPEIYYKRSTDGGATWEPDTTRLTNDPAYSFSASAAVSGSNVHVVWRDDRNGANGEIYYKRSTDGGVNWGTDTRLTDDPAFSRYPSVAVSGSNVHVVWHDYRDGDYEIYYKRSTNGGGNWGTDTRLTDNSGSSGYPSIAVSG